MQQNHQTPNIKWTNEEMELALCYYVFVFSKNKTDKMMTIFWADLIKITKNNRTLGSIQMRMSNYSYIDPQVKKGYSGGAPRCKECWAKYMMNDESKLQLFGIFSNFVKKANNPDAYSEFMIETPKCSFVQINNETLSMIEKEIGNETYFSLTKKICIDSSELINYESNKIDDKILASIIISAYKLCMIKKIDINSIINQLYKN